MKSKTTLRRTFMATKKIEVFSAGCPACKETIDVVKRLAGPSHEVVVHDMNKSEVASKAKRYGVRRGRD